MKFGFSLLILAACLGCASAQASNLNRTSTLPYEGIPPTTVLGDIPLMQGLQPETDGNYIRLLSESSETQPVVTLGIVDVDDVYNFYKRTLPPLGWTPISGRDYMKDARSLHILAHADGKTSTVTFTEETVAP